MGCGCEGKCVAERLWRVSISLSSVPQEFSPHRNTTASRSLSFSLSLFLSFSLSLLTLSPVSLCRHRVTTRRYSQTETYHEEHAEVDSPGGEEDREEVAARAGLDLADPLHEPLRQHKSRAKNSDCV